MQQGIVKRVGDKRVDVQLQGSAATLTNVAVSAQVSWELLQPGTFVLVDMVNGQPLVLHTLSHSPLYYAPQQQTYTAILEGALLADGSVPLTGDLPVTPGVTVDGYDISVLGQAIDNLQAADGVARTGFTVLTHASHLVENIGENDTQILIRHAYFADAEQLLVSNADGQIEFMRVVGEPEATVDNDGAVCYRYTVVRRIATNPAGVRTGWAAATVVNGLTMKGYIAFDARHNRPTTPAMRFVLFTDPAAGETEQIVRMGALANILGFDADDYGFAVGKLTTGNRYIAYSYAADLLSLRGADISVSDEGGAEVFRVWATFDGEHAPGDARLGHATGGHIETFGDQVWFFAGSDPVMFLSPAGTRFRNMVWSGTQPGPQIGIGEQDGQAHIVARNQVGLEQFHVRTGDDKVHVHIGNPPPYEHWMRFDEVLVVDGTFRVRDGIILGLLDMGENGEIRFGTGMPGVDFSGLRIGAIDDGDGLYQLAGYENDQKQAYFGPDGRIYWAGGKGSADAAGIRHVHSPNAYWEVLPSGVVLSRIVATGLALGVGLEVVAASGRGVQAQATTGWALEGSATEGIGVYGSAAEAGGVGVKAVAFSGATALAIEGGVVDGGSQRYTNLANATAGTDALPKGQADGLYAVKASEHSPVTLDSAADTLLSLTGQQVTLDAQPPGTVLAGPVGEEYATPTFRALTAADLPAHKRYIWLEASDPATGITASRRLKLAGGVAMDTGADNVGWPMLRGGVAQVIMMRAKVTSFDGKTGPTLAAKLYKNGSQVATSTPVAVAAVGWVWLVWVGSASFNAYDRLQVEVALTGTVTVERPHATVELLLNAV